MSGGTKVMTRSSSLGKILVDAKGHTLYLFEKDKQDRSARRADERRGAEEVRCRVVRARSQRQEDRQGLT
jgi:hypothetical protein